MGIFFFYNNRKPRKFQHRTIMFDSDEEARKEKMEKRIRRIQQEVAREEGREIEFEEKRSKPDFGKEFVSQTKYLKRRKEREEEGSKPFFTNNITIVLILAALVVLFYILFFR